MWKRIILPCHWRPPYRDHTSCHRHWCCWQKQENCVKRGERGVERKREIEKESEIERKRESWYRERREESHRRQIDIKAAAPLLMRAERVLDGNRIRTAAPRRDDKSCMAKSFVQSPTTMVLIIIFIVYYTLYNRNPCKKKRRYIIK